MSFMMLTAASDRAEIFDRLFLGLMGFSVLIVLLVAGLLIGFSIRFRSGSGVERHRVPRLLGHEIEIGWTVATAFAALFIFWWTAAESIHQQEPPANALEIHVTAKQWMWKASHEGGARELNSLHVPVDQPVKLYLDSQDVIHSFFVPAFRLKQDVVPGRTSVLWFEANTPGTYPLLCAEYCGTVHSKMLGDVVVMTPADFSRWLDERPEGEGLVAQGRALFNTAGCSGCHAPNSAVHAPDLAGLYGREVPLADGRTVKADAAYLRDSILLPRRDIAAGFKPIMPDFEGLLDADEVEALVAYIRNLKGGSP